MQTILHYIIKKKLDCKNLNRHILSSYIPYSKIKSKLSLEDYLNFSAGIILIKTGYFINPVIFTIKHFQ